MSPADPKASDAKGGDAPPNVVLSLVLGAVLAGVAHWFRPDGSSPVAAIAAAPLIALGIHLARLYLHHKKPNKPDWPHLPR